MKYLSFIILFLLLQIISLHAQTQCYQALRKEGLSLLAKKNYRNAIDKFFAARYCPDKPAKDDLDALIKKTQDQWVKALDEAVKVAGVAQEAIALALAKVTQEKNRADAERDKALQAQQAAETEKQNALIARNEADSQRQKVQAVLDKIYFYDDKFGLAYDNGRYGFIDKGLHIKIPFKYDEALPFSFPGYAKVKRYNEVINDDCYCLIDTFGVEYPLVTETRQLRSDVTALNLNGQEIKRVPKSIFEHTQLKVLWLNNNWLTTLPEQIYELKNLQDLNLSFNGLNQIPVQIGKLKNLQKLDLTFNQLNQIPKQIGELKNLQKLTLNKNRLTALPEQIGELKNLHELYLSGNQLTTLPEQIGELKNLHILYLFENRLTTLPEQIGELKNLHILYLPRNQLAMLPERIGELENMQQLNLNRNKLTTLPESIRQLKSLKHLDLRVNPFSAEYIAQLRRDMPWCEIYF